MQGNQVGAAESGKLQELTKKQLLELEREKKSKLQRWMDLVIWLLPFLGGLAAVLEYTQIPDNSMNRNPNTYLVSGSGLIIRFHRCPVYADCPFF